MSLVGFFLIVLGAVLNVSMLRRPHSAGLTAGDVLRSWPWLGSLALVALGVALLLIGGHP